MSNRFTILLLLGFALMMMQSCTYGRLNNLFKTKKEIKTDEPVLVVNPTDTTNQIYRHRIKVGDRLQIRFLNNYDIGGGANKSATAGANIDASAAVTNGIAGYMVNYDSTVILPLLGRINLVGLTRLDASKKLEQEYGKFVVNPIIDLNIVSLRATVLGEVNTQGKVLLDKENTTIVDVIALAGGIKDTGKKKNIKIIRGNEIIIIDLKQIEALKYSEIVMHDGDIVYVEAYNVKSRSEPLVAAVPVTTFLLTLMTTTLLLYQFAYLYSTR